MASSTTSGVACCYFASQVQALLIVAASAGIACSWPRPVKQVIRYDTGNPARALVRYAWLLDAGSDRRKLPDSHLAECDMVIAGVTATPWTL